MALKHRNMKKLTYILLVICYVMLTGCNSKEEALDIVGDWELSEAVLNTKAIQIGDETIEVYLSFSEDGSFKISQKIGYGKFVLYKGTYTTAGNVLSGTYSDGTAWGNSYTVSTQSDVMTLSAVTNSTDIYTYRKCSIPSDVLNQATER